MFNLLWFISSPKQSQGKKGKILFPIWHRKATKERAVPPYSLQRVRKKGLFLLFLLLIGFWSMALGIGIARAINPHNSTDNSSLATISQNDNFLFASTIQERYKAAQQLYIETCSGCHIPISPSVLPSESWKEILENPDRHFGTSVKMIRITQVLLWEYLATFSRPLSRNEPKPVYITQARYFKALHPRVDLPKPTTIKTCIVCHPAAQDYDYQTLSPQWDNAP